VAGGTTLVRVREVTSEEVKSVLETRVMWGTLKEDCSWQRKQQVQRPSGRSKLACSRSRRQMAIGWVTVSEPTVRLEQEEELEPYWVTIRSFYNRWVSRSAQQTFMLRWSTILVLILDWILDPDATK
jgi:hypothetical protein